MSGVLRPVGPEPERVYWLRRVVVVAAAVLALVLLIVIVVNLNSPASASGPEAVPPPAPVSTPTPEPATPAAPSPSATPRTTVTPAPTQTGSTASAAKPSGASKARPSSKASTNRSASAKPSPAAIAACDPAQLRPTLTGKQAVKVKTKTDLNLSLINGGPQPCRLSLSSENFALTIYSGRDRIWSTQDCTDLVKPVSVKIASQDAYEWRLVWDGRRSKKSCKTRPEIPKAGTYVATAQFEGTDPVRFRMFLKN